MEPIFKAATDRRDELERQRDEIVQEIKKIEYFLATYRSLSLGLRVDSMNKEGTQTSSTENTISVGNSEAVEVGVATPTVWPPPRSYRIRGNPKPSVVIPATLEVIREHGRPMSRREIWLALRERGIFVNGADPVKALGTILWRSGQGQLTQIEGQGYWDPRLRPIQPEGGVAQASEGSAISPDDPHEDPPETAA